VSDVAQNTHIEGERSTTSDTIPELGRSIQDIMRELKRAVEAEGGTPSQLPEAQTQPDNSDTIFGSIKAVVEIVTALARQCSDSGDRICEKFLVLDTAINSLVDQTSSIQRRLPTFANLETELKALAADNQRTSATIADLSAQLSHLQTNLTSWQAERSNEVLQNKFDALAARVQLLETRTECLGDVKSDTRRANATLSTMTEDVESLFSQLAAVSKQVNTTATRVETFRRHFEQIPD
jgi:chromosome segregation ATPase